MEISLSQRVRNADACEDAVDASDLGSNIDFQLEVGGIASRTRSLRRLLGSEQKRLGVFGDRSVPCRAETD